MNRITNIISGAALVLTAMASCDVAVLDVTFDAAAAGNTYSSTRGGTTSGGGSTFATASSSRQYTAGTSSTAAAGGPFGSSSLTLGGFAGVPAASVAGGGATSMSTSTTVPWRSGLRPSPFCDLAFGTRRDALGGFDNPRRQLSFSSVQFLSGLVGNEEANKLEGSNLRMLLELRPDSSSSLRGKMPVFYAPIMAFKAHDQAGLDFCGSDSSRTLCSDGAEWIRNNRDYLREVYDGYAWDIANVWGTSRPLIWMFEPGLSDYLASSQNSPLSLKELDTVTSDLIGQIRSRLPNAKISLHASAQIEDLFDYFGAIDLSLVHMVNVSGPANNERFATPTDPDNPNATYANLSAATGLPIFVDTGFGNAAIENHAWLSSDADVINARIADGVFAVLIDSPPSNMDALVEGLRPQLNHLYCE